MTCKLGALVLPATDRALLDRWLETGLDSKGRSVPASVMARALSAEGYGVGPTTVKAHRSKTCACYREG